MAKKRWKRYRPPGEVRTEDGRPRPKKVIPPRPRTSTRAKSTAARTAVQTRKSNRPGWLVGAIVAGVLVVPAAIGVITNEVEDSSSTSEVATELIDEGFIGESLAHALEEEGDHATLVRFDEYGLSVDYFDPNKNQIRTVETNSYAEGFTVRVGENHYDDFRPRPFDLKLLEPAALVRAVEDALTRVDDPDTFSVRIQADRETGKVTMVTYVSGDERADVVADLDGDFVRVERA